MTPSRSLRLALVCAVLAGMGCDSKGVRFRSRQPIQLTAGSGEVGTNGRLVLRATRQGRPDPELRWSVLDAGGGVVLPGGVYLAPPRPGIYRVQAQDPRSGEKAETRLTVIVDAGMPGDPSTAEIYDPGLVQGAPTARMRVGRIGHAACLLRDGRVLVTGGRSHPNGSALASAECFDPATASWAPSLALGEPRVGHSLVPLLDGTVLVLGGGPVLAERFDPAKDRYLPAGLCNAATGLHRTLVLANGDVLVVGTGIERFNRATGRFQRVLADAGPTLAGASLTELTDGTVLIAGGTTSADLFQLDLQQGKLERRGALSRGRAWHEAHRMPGLQVLFYGGTPAPGQALDAVEELDLQTWSIKVGPPLEGTVAGMAGLKLEDGKLVALGAREGPEGQKAVSLLLPVAHQIRPLRELTMGRVGHTLTLMKDGRILVVGGYEKADGPFQSRLGAGL